VNIFGTFKTSFHAIDLDSICYGIERKQLVHLAFDCAEKKNFSHRFSKVKKGDRAALGLSFL
jgi:hypothetical protein